MPSISKTILATATFAALAQAYTQPVGNPTWGALRSPDINSNVVRGEKFTITWDPTNQVTDGKTVSLVLCRGPAGTCQLAPTAIVEGLPAGQRTYEWTVPCSLAPGTASTATGNGMLVIVDGTGEFQYSTQFSVQEGSTCGAIGGATTSGSSPTGSPSATGSAATSSSGSTTSAVTTTAVTTTVVTTTHTTTVPSTTASIPSGVVTTTIATTTRSTGGSSTTTSRATSATTSATTPNSAARATGAAGALLAVGVALLAL